MELSMPGELGPSSSGEGPGENDSGTHTCNSNSETKNPRDGANALSVLFFWWMNGVLRLGNKRPLADKDLFPVLNGYKSEVLVDEVEKCWMEELKRSQSKNRKPRLWKAMIRFIPWESHCLTLVLKALQSLSFVFLPLCLWLVLKTINDGSRMDTKFAFISVALLGITSAIQAVTTHHYNNLADLWGLRLKVALIGLVYKKVLSLNRYSLEATLSGNTINLVSNDAQKVQRNLSHVAFVLSAPMELIINLVILWYLIGWEALVGAAIFFVIVPFQMLLAKKSAKLREKAAAFTDKRLVVMNEIISGIRAVKMYAWEWNFRDVVRDIRRKEMSLIRFRGIIVAMLLILFFTTVPIAVLISVTTLVLTGTYLSSATVFTLFLGFVTLRTTFCYNLSMALHSVLDAKVATDRMQAFLDHDVPMTEGTEDQDNTEKRTESLSLTNPIYEGLSEQFLEQARVPFIATDQISGSSSKKPFLSISDISCRWNQDNLTETLREITLSVSSGSMLAITGPVGCGKSSLLTAILSELPLSGGDISYHGKLAYVPQIPWVFSGTIRENILFGLPFNKEMFRNVVDMCGLTKDLAVFTNGDLTEIGQRGVTLSGGQKARVGLARAVYSDADIYLLDDPLSAVDIKVGRRLFEACIVGHLSARIRLLVTHQLHYLKHLDHIAVMENGSIVHQGGYTDLEVRGILSGISELSESVEDESVSRKSAPLDYFNDAAVISKLPVSFVKRTEGEDNDVFEDDLPKMSKDENEEEKDYNTSLPESDHGPVLDLMEEEESKTAGTVTWRLYWDYFRAGLPVPLIMILVISLILAQVCLLAPNWWLAQMAEMSHDQQKAAITQVIHACLVAVFVVVGAGSSFFFTLAVLKASENLHNKMTLSVIKAPVLFFDTNPAGRILNRFSKDVGSMDDVLPASFLHASIACLFTIFVTIVPAAVNYWLFLPLPPLFAIFIYFARYYLKSSRELKRIEAIKCSPVYSHITETTHGLEVVHTSNMNRTFLKRLHSYQDENTQAFFMLVSCVRWFGLRLDVLCSVFIMIVAVAAILITKNISPALAALALTYAMQTLNIAQHGMRVATEVENLMTSAQRVMAYTEINSESGYNTETRPPESWPNEGSLATQNLSLVYFEGGPRILKDINFCVSSKEKVGVVGRTGAGKSSLVSALFRMPDPSGKVLIDGVDITSINLQEARRCMSVITQDPVLFGGTLKRNMDPFTQYTDEDLWTALEGVQLKTLVENLPGQLEFKLKESGTNLSVGERQLVCLARALVQKSKIIIMDEATANVDFKTDRLIQEVIRHKFKDATVLTIAHRLNTILNYDKVLVLHDGQVVEFDKPEVLIRNGGLFAEMVESQKQSEKH